MRNLIDGKETRFKIIEKPANLPAYKAKAQLYYDVLNTLEVLSGEKCVQMSFDECGVKPLNFVTYLKGLAKKLDKHYRVVTHIDEQKDTIFIWKQDKIGKSE